MAEILNDSVAPQRGKRRAKRHTAQVDMTPMVDLACLLLTFFILTTAFTKSKVMEIVMPRETKVNVEVPKDRVVNIILAKDGQLFFYNGLADPAKGVLPPLIKSNYTKNGIRKVLLERNKILFEKIYGKNDSIARGLGKYKSNPSKDLIAKEIKMLGAQDKIGPIVLIKAADGATYGNMVDIMDEMAITNVVRYTLVDLNYVEKKMLSDAYAGKNIEVQ